jgi:hypothetical protein
MTSQQLPGQSCQQSGQPLKYPKSKTGEPGDYASRLTLESHRTGSISQSTPNNAANNFDINCGNLSGD